MILKSYIILLFESVWMFWVTLMICLFFFTELLNSQILSTRTASEEAMTVLEEVIMFTFQQMVYYLTRVSTHSYTQTFAHSFLNRPT